MRIVVTKFPPNHLGSDVIRSFRGIYQPRKIRIGIRHPNANARFRAILGRAYE
jgi:hypothetical protein